MGKKYKIKDSNTIGLKDCLGTTTLSTISALTGVLMSTMFMQYMTDYAEFLICICTEIRNYTKKKKI